MRTNSVNVVLQMTKAQKIDVGLLSLVLVLGAASLANLWPHHHLAPVCAQCAFLGASVYRKRAQYREGFEALRNFCDVFRVQVIIGLHVIALACLIPYLAHWTTTLQGGCSN